MLIQIALYAGICISAVFPSQGHLKSRIIKRRIATFSDGFKVKSLMPFPNLNIHGVHLKHSLSGADYFHIMTEGESEKAFCIAFRTPSCDNSGVAGAVENMVSMGGSKYFPSPSTLEDLYLKYQNESIYGLTTNDRTLFSFAAHDQGEYEEFRRFYFDSSFNPLLRRSDFRELVWRYGEFRRIYLDMSSTSPNESDYTKLAWKSTDAEAELSGKLYNCAIPDEDDYNAIMTRHVNRLLFNDTMYEHECTGLPDQIPFLTIEKVREYHRRYYRLSNCLFMSMGDGKVLDDNLSFLNDQISELYLHNHHGKEHFRASCSTPLLLQKGTKTETVKGPSSFLFDYVLWKSSSDMNEHAKLILINQYLTLKYDSALQEAMGPESLFIPSRYVNAAPVNMLGIALGFEEFRKPKALTPKLVDDALKHVIAKGICTDTMEDISHGILTTLLHPKWPQDRVSIFDQIANDWARGRSIFNLLFLHGNVLPQVVEETDSDEYARMIKSHLIGDHISRAILRIDPDPENYHITTTAAQKKFIERNSAYLKAEDERNRAETESSSSPGTDL